MARRHASAPVHSGSSCNTGAAAHRGVARARLRGSAADQQPGITRECMLAPGDGCAALVGMSPLQHARFARALCRNTTTLALRALRLNHADVRAGRREPLAVLFVLVAVIWDAVACEAESFAAGFSAAGFSRAGSLVSAPRRAVIVAVTFSGTPGCAFLGCAFLGRAFSGCPFLGSAALVPTSGAERSRPRAHGPPRGSRLVAGRAVSSSCCIGVVQMRVSCGALGRAGQTTPSTACCSRLRSAGSSRGERRGSGCRHLRVKRRAMQAASARREHRASLARPNPRVERFAMIVALPTRHTGFAPRATPCARVPSRVPRAVEAAWRPRGLVARR